METKGRIRFDYLFSYWIYTWFFLYVFVPKSNTFMNNPHLVFWIAFVENMTTWLIMMIYQVEWTILVKYALMILIAKGIPLYVLRKEKINWLQDSLIIIILFVAYNGYLWINETDLIEVYERTFWFVMSGSNKTPMFEVFEWISRVLFAKP